MGVEGHQSETMQLQASKVRLRGKKINKDTALGSPNEDLESRPTYALALLDHHDYLDYRDYFD